MKTHRSSFNTIHVSSFVFSLNLHVLYRLNIIIFNLLYQAVHGFFKVLFDIALPYSKNSPASSNQFISVQSVILNISFKFLLPEFNPALRHICFFTAWMSVPETPVYKNNCMILWQNDIRLSGQGSHMLPVPESLFEKIFPDLYLYRCIFPFNT